MQNTTNYNLNLVEGTDLVNPPIQFNPNFQTIDAAMFANKEASIGTASEVVTGSVHAIVRANQDADVFRFTATGAWTAGDTMTIDGTSVTVHLSDGTVPPTGAYIIGAEVLAVLNGTLVTLMIGMTPPAQGVTSFNGRSGAVVPTAGDYVASDIDYDNTTSGLTSTDAQTAIDELADSLTWKYIGITTASTPLAVDKLSGTYKVIAETNDGGMFTFEIPVNHLSGTETVLPAGASYTAASYLGISIGATLTAIRCIQFYASGVNNTANITLTVYHKADKYV